MEQIQRAYCISKETDTAITMFYENTKAMFCSADGNIGFFDNVTGVLQEDT